MKNLYIHEFNIKFIFPQIMTNPTKIEVKKINDYFYIDLNVEIINKANNPNSSHFSFSNYPVLKTLFSNCEKDEKSDFDFDILDMKNYIMTTCASKIEKILIANKSEEEIETIYKKLRSIDIASRINELKWKQFIRSLDEEHKYIENIESYQIVQINIYRYDNDDAGCKYFYQLHHDERIYRQLKSLEKERFNCKKLEFVIKKN